MSAFLKPATRRPLVNQQEAGLSLIELMIAIALGVLLILGIVQVFGTTRAVYQTASGLSRVQESGRFALDFLKRDLRMVGQWGCFNEYTPLRKFYNHFSTNLVESTAPWPFRTDLPIEVFEYTGTAPGDSVTLTADPDPVGSGASWSPALPTGLADAVTNAIPNSDVLVVRYAEAESVTLAGTNLGGGQVGVPMANLAFVESGRVYVATDCKQISLFQASSAATAGDLPPGDSVQEAIFVAQYGTGTLNQPRIASGPQAWAENYFGAGSGGVGEGSPLSRFRFAAYYVAPSARDGSMSLWRVELAAPASLTATNMLGTPRELIEGVESMQVVLGVTDAVTNLDDYQGAGSDDYVSADDLIGSAATPVAYAAALRRVKKVRVSLLLRSPDPGAVATGGAAISGRRRESDRARG